MSEDNSVDNQQPQQAHGKANDSINCLNQQFINTNHVNYDSSSSEQENGQVNNESQEIDDSIARNLHKMLKPQQERQNSDEQQQQVRPQRNGRGNRGNRQADKDNENEENKQQASSGRRRGGNIKSENQDNSKERNEKQKDLQKENDSKKVETNSKEEKQAADNNDESQAWDVQSEKEDKIQGKRNGRGTTKVQQKQSSDKEQDQQLVPDNPGQKKHDTSNWDDDVKQQESKPSEKTGRGNRNTQQDEQKSGSEAPRGRGNRGRTTQQNRQETNEGNYQRPDRGNRDFRDRPQNNNWNRDRYDNNRQDGRGRGRGRGGYFGNGQGRGNNERNFNNNNQEERQGQDRGFNRNNQQNHQNNYQKNQNQPYNNNQQNLGNLSERSSATFAKNENPPVYDASKIIEPKGIKSWPQISLYIKKCKVSLTLRNLSEHQATVLFFPFQNLQFKLYPSTLINKASKKNYRQRIKQKLDKQQFDKLPIWLTPSHGLGDFKYVVFLKLNEVDNSKGVQDFFGLVESNNIKIESILVPICKEFKDFKTQLELFSNYVENTDKKQKEMIEGLKRIQFTTKDPGYFSECMKEFSDKISANINENKIYIE